MLQTTPPDQTSPSEGERVAVVALQQLGNDCKHQLVWLLLLTHFFCIAFLEEPEYNNPMADPEVNIDPEHGQQVGFTVPPHRYLPILQLPTNVSDNKDNAYNVLEKHRSVNRASRPPTLEQLSTYEWLVQQ